MTDPLIFAFRPWVRRAGFSVLLVAAILTALVLAAAAFSEDARYGWAGERVVAIYLAALWTAGVKVYGGTIRPFAEMTETTLVIRPLHLFRQRRIAWERMAGTEQMMRGDRLIVYFHAPRGLRFVAVNLNLVKGRREFLHALEERLRSLGFQEKILGESRFLSRSAA